MRYSWKLHHLQLFCGDGISTLAFSAPKLAVEIAISPFSILFHSIFYNFGLSSPQLFPHRIFYHIFYISCHTAANCRNCNLYTKYHILFTVAILSLWYTSLKYRGNPNIYYYYVVVTSSLPAESSSIKIKSYLMWTTALLLSSWRHGSGYIIIAASSTHVCSTT